MVGLVSLRQPQDARHASQFGPDFLPGLSANSCPRARKIKCDEAKPNCFRCTKSARKCMGYEPWQVVTSGTYQDQLSSQGSYRRSLSISPGSEEEQLCFQYFTEHASKCIAGVLDTTFWSLLLPRISQTTPAVKHCIVAISSLFRVRFHSIQSSIHHTSPIPYYDTQKAISIALKHYNKAIMATMADMIRDCEDVLVAVLTCILFFCIESLQGRPNEACSLYHRGQNLIDDLDERPTPSPSDSYNIIKTDLKPIFGRLRVLAALHGSPRPIKRSAPPPSFPDGISQDTVPFITIEDARSDLFSLTEEIHHFMASSFNLKWSTDTTSLEIDHLRLKDSFRLWRRRASPILHLTPTSDIPLTTGSAQAIQNRIARLILMSHYLIIHIWLECALATNESCYDDHIEVFQTIVAMAERVKEIHDAVCPDSTRTYTFEMGLIPPLFMTARKCRDPALRRQAVALLSKGATQEGLWNVSHSINVAARCIALEERYLPHKSNERGWPCEEDRLYETMITARITTAHGHSGSIARFYSRRPNDEGWEIWEEHIDLSMQNGNESIAAPTVRAFTGYTSDYASGRAHVYDSNPPKIVHFDETDAIAEFDGIGKLVGRPG